jgi:tetratricopeptide (TPR) repeat protein
MRRVAGLTLGLGVALSGCLAGHAELAPASAGGNAWSELKTDHFRIVTDLKERDAVNVLAEYEHVYQLLVSATHLSSAQGSLQAPSFETQAVVFRDYDELHPFVPAQMVGIYQSSLPNEIEGVPTILASGTLSPFGRVLFAHELAHRFNHVALGAMPVWLNEGLAEYYSTIRGEVSAPVVGESDPENVAAAGGVYHSVGDVIYQGSLIHADLLPKASALVAFDADGFYAESFGNHAPLSYEAKNTQARNYAAAWMLVHMLLHESSDYALRFRELLGKPDTHTTGSALQGVLEHVAAERLDRDFKAYLLKDIPWRQYHPGLSKPPELTSRALPDSEVLTWWARLDAFNGDSASRAAKRLADAQRANSKDAEVWFWLGRQAALQGQAADAASNYEHAVELAPERPDFLLGLVTLYIMDSTKSPWPDREQRLDQTITKLEPVARSPLQLNVLAIRALHAHDLSKSQVFAQKACDAGPDCWECWHTLAEAAFIAGDAARALKLERTALARVPENLSEPAYRALRDAASLYELAAQAPRLPQSKLPPLFVPE